MAFDYVLYPRGYISKVGQISRNDDTFTEANGDGDVNALYDIYLNRSVNIESWEFRSRVLMTAARLFNQFSIWLSTQVVSNDRIYGLNLEFLKDTALFIKTGHRNMSITTWSELLLEYPKETPGIAKPKRWDSDFNIIVNDDDNDFLGKWCSHQGGFNDLICTLHILFGTAKKAKQPPEKTV